MSRSEPTKKTVGLAGVIAGQSAICTCGVGNGLNYYGYSIEELEQIAEFEEIAYLLQFGELPIAKELENYKVKIIAQ